jgi:hypothetical protein
MSVFTCRAATLKNVSFPLGDAIFMAGTVRMWGCVHVCGGVGMYVGCMYICLWGCMYVCGVYVHICVGVYLCIYVCGDVCICVGIYVCVCECTLCVWT